MYVTFRQKKKKKRTKTESIVISQPNCWLFLCVHQTKKLSFFLPFDQFHDSLYNYILRVNDFRSISFLPIDVWAIRLSSVLQSSKSTRCVCCMLCHVLHRQIEITMGRRSTKLQYNLVLKNSFSVVWAMRRWNVNNTELNDASRDQGKSKTSIEWVL